ncbi:hypothetical protein FRX31_007943 [Thalictrum thalictroides]|uniref:Uncharacterized protein n=1 Tax=Thalictrum thalictroides TaxID=46969 RepID=A0A7J6X179_THATH|nr:hypothetical protein FRX31_007943 [Thalictrum thalictroides]
MKRQVIAERIGEYIFLVINQVFKFLMELIHIGCWDSEIATIIVEGIKEVPEHIMIKIPELEEIISYAEDVRNASERWEVSNGEILRNRVIRWRWGTCRLKNTLKKWAKCPTQVLNSMDEDYDYSYDNPKSF